MLQHIPEKSITGLQRKIKDWNYESVVYCLQINKQWRQNRPQESPGHCHHVSSPRQNSTAKTHLGIVKLQLHQKVHYNLSDVSKGVEWHWEAKRVNVFAALKQRIRDEQRLGQAATGRNR